jgi:hypothetical protein
MSKYTFFDWGRVSRGQMSLIRRNLLDMFLKKGSMKVFNEYRGHTSKNILKDRFLCFRLIFLFRGYKIMVLTVVKHLKVLVESHIGGIKDAKEFFDLLRAHAIHEAINANALVWWLICAIRVFAPRPRQAKSRELIS